MVCSDVAEADVGVYTASLLAAISPTLRNKSTLDFFVSSRSLSISLTAAFRGALTMRLIRNELVERVKNG